MAIGFHRIGYVSRSTCRSAVQAYAYISGTCAVDSRTGQIADYRNKSDGVSCAGILAPAGAPDWAHTPEIWNRLEAFVDETIEGRYKLPETILHYKNTARITQTHIFALPIELKIEDWEEISKDFLVENFSSRGLVTGYAIHADDGNPHLHVSVSLHALEGDTFVPVKSRELYQNIFRKEVFSNYADLFNARLLERGFSVQIDPRSYEERELELLPHVHEGWHARDLAEQGKHAHLVVENELIRSHNANAILRNTSLILQELSQTHATFSEEQLLKCVQKRMNDDPVLSSFVFDSVLKEAHHVGHDIEGNSRYATTEYRLAETNALSTSMQLITQNHPRTIAHEQIKKAIQHVNQSKGYDLSIEQENAVYTACNPKQLSLLVGRAGTGKTSSLQAIVQLHKAAGFHVVGMAISAEAARHLGNDAGIDSKTISSFELRWKKIKEHEEALSSPRLSMRQRSEHIRKLNALQLYDLKPNSLIIMDESGMIGTTSMQHILQKAVGINAKVLLVGDDRQFKAIDAGDIFRKQVDIAKEHQGYSELTRIVRQKHDWMVEASTALAEFNPTHALDRYAQKGHVHGLHDEEAVIEQISEAYVNHVVHQNNPSGLVITFTNDACAKLNLEIRSKLQIQGVVDSASHEVNGVHYSKNDQIIFLKNSYSDALSIKSLTGSPLNAILGKSLRGVTNGTKGVVQSITPLWDMTTGELLDHRFVVHIQKDGDVYEASFNAKDYSTFQHGYAITLYKSQGQTVNWAMVYATPHMDATAAYVAMTRHEHALDLFYSTEDFPTYHALGTRLSRFHAKDLVLDYERDPKTQLIFDNVQSYVLLGREMAHALKSGSTSSYEEYGVERKVLAKEILANFGEHGGFILQQGLTKGHLEIVAGLRGRTLSHLEERVLISVEQYIEVALSCRDVWQSIRTTHPGVYAKQHPEYARLKELQEERGSLAHNLITYAPIVRSFGKEIYTGTGYGFSTIQKQGKAFEHQSLQSEALIRLSPDDQRDIALYKAMLLHQQHATHLYKEHQAKDDVLRNRVKSHGKALFKTLVTDAEKTERLKMEACTGALSAHILNRMDHFEALAETLKLSLNHDQIKGHALRYNRQHMIHVALGTAMPFEKEVAALMTTLGFDVPSPLHFAQTTKLSQMLAARELVMLMTEDEQSGRKAITKAVILTEVGLDGLKHIYNFARHEQRLHVNMAFGKETLNQEVYELITYSDACANVNQMWHRVREEATQKGISFKESSHYADYEQASGQRDLIAYQISTTHTAAHQDPVARLRQANALLMSNGVGVSLTAFEKHKESGVLHQACLTVTDPNTSELSKNDAMETLFTGLMLDDQRMRTINILDMHKLTRMYLVDKALEHIGDKMPHHKDALNAYQHALQDYKKTFRDFIGVHGTDFSLLEHASPEALRVREAENVRDEAAFHLRPLLTEDVPHRVMSDLLTHLKVSQSQILHQGDRHESLAWVHAFKNNASFDLPHSFAHEPVTHIPDHARWAYSVLERFVLECATKTPNSVSYALKAEGLTLQEIQKKAHTHIVPHLSDRTNQTLFGYQQAILAFGQSYNTLMLEFKDAQTANNALDKPKRLYISHMNAYSDFWTVRSDLAKVSYFIQENTEQLGGDTSLSHYLSDRSHQKLGSYAHIHETTLLIQGYAAAKSTNDPIALNIAHELSEILSFEAHEKKHNPSNPLVFGTIAALYHHDINVTQLNQDALLVHPDLSLRAKEISYLLEGGSPSPEVLTVVQNTRYLPSKTTHAEAPSIAHKEDVINESALHATAAKSRAALSTEDFKNFTREVKEHLINDIENVATDVLGQPTRMEKNGIWHWPKGVRLHTRNGVVPRGTFKMYSIGTHNIDVFGMIKNTYGYTRAWDAISFGATLCGKTLDGQALSIKARSKSLEHHTETKASTIEERWSPLFPVPHELEHVDIEHRPGLSFMLKTVGQETMRFAYRDENDRLLGYVVRLETEDGHKQTLPLTYCQNGKGLAAWKWKGFGDITPLYGLDRLAHKSNAPVLLVEGEKAADAAQKLFPEMAVLSWVGGSAGVKKVDLTPLLNKTVVMWPDNDDAGAKAAATLAERFEELAEKEKLPSTFKIISIPHDKLPQKWDLADNLPHEVTLKEVKKHIVDTLNEIKKSLPVQRELPVEHENASTHHAQQDQSKHTHTQGEHATPTSHPITFEEINLYAKACGLEFVANAENMHFIIHVANKTMKDIHTWHGVLGKECNPDQSRYQAISTGLYTAWSKTILRSHKHEKDTILEKSLAVGVCAARIKADQIEQDNANETSAVGKRQQHEIREYGQLHAQTVPNNHTIIAQARNALKTMETEKQKQLENAPDFLRTCSVIEREEIIRTIHQCHILTGHNVSESVVKSLAKTLRESMHDDNHQHEHVTHREAVRGVIHNTLEQHADGVKLIEPIHHEAARHAHQQEQHKLQHAIQTVHTQTLHREQQREIEHQIGRGIER